MTALPKDIDLLYRLSLWYSQILISPKVVQAAEILAQGFECNSQNERTYVAAISQ